MAGEVSLRRQTVDLSSCDSASLGFLQERCSHMTPLQLGMRLHQTMNHLLLQGPRRGHRLAYCGSGHQVRAVGVGQQLQTIRIP